MLKRTQSDPQGDLTGAELGAGKQTLHHRLSDVRMSPAAAGRFTMMVWNMFEFDAFHLARLQFAFTVSFHILFRPSPSALPATLWCLRGCGCEPG